MERTYYELINMSGQSTTLPDRETLQQKLRAMREKKKGYFVYELTETETSRHRRFVRGWSPIV